MGGRNVNSRDAQPRRIPWNGFPDVVIHAPEPAVKRHRAYAAAKTGDAEAARILVDETVSPEAAARIARLGAGARPFLASAHAFESHGVNAIPEALADKLAALLDWDVEHAIVQTNIVAHTGASGFARLARQAVFEGSVARRSMYVLVDDFVGQGGTLANLRGFIEAEGGQVLGATALTGKPYSAKISLEQNLLNALRVKHGNDLESWWLDRFGHAFDCLTQSEARYLERSENADAIRNRIAAAEQG
jgi:hypothetical protein